jgi:uncharacterized membrane protein YphA (DoxX/SURF4 family)
MAQSISGVSTRDIPLPKADQNVSQHSRQAYQLLHVAYVVAPVVAGIDKFFHILVNWDQYLPATVNNMVGGHGHQLMMVVGVIEVVAGIGVALMPRVFAYVVAAWLLLIIINLLMIPGYFDVSLRDLGLMLGALALGRLSHDFNR